MQSIYYTKIESKCLLLRSLDMNRAVKTGYPIYFGFCWIGLKNLDVKWAQKSKPEPDSK
jgi:hypothetical protein